MRKNKVSTTQIIALGFVILVVVGGLLLMLPVASRDGQWTSLIDAMFTAGTSSCVTGLVVVNTLEHWSFFGQFVIMCLIQIGGLGVVTMISMFMIIFGSRLSVHQRLLL